jgi:hypothetical protein
LNSTFGFRLVLAHNYLLMTLIRISITQGVTEQKMKNKNILQKRSLIDQERHFVLDMPTSETAHARRKRENTPTKQHQRKA